MKETRLLCYLGCKTVQKMYVDEIPNEPESISVSKIATYNCPKCGMSYDKAFIDDYITKNPNDFLLYYLGKQVARIHARIDAEKSKSRERAAQSMERKIMDSSLTPLTEEWLNGQMALIELNPEFEYYKTGLLCQGFGLHDGAKFARTLELRMHRAEDALEEIGKFVAFFNAAFAPMTVQQEEIMKAFWKIKDLFDGFGKFK